jgi:hypothetical protein
MPAASPWTAARQTIARACDAAFTRLAWARLLQWLMFSPVLRTSIGALFLRSDRLWQFLLPGRGRNDS